MFINLAQGQLSICFTEFLLNSIICESYFTDMHHAIVADRYDIVFMHEI